VVDRHIDQASAGQGQRVTRAGKARVFDPDRVAGLEQRASGDGERLLRAAHDHDLVRGAPHRAHRPQVIGERLAQGRKAHHVAVHHLAAGQQARPPCDQARPHVGRKLVEGRLGGAKRAPEVEPGFRGDRQQFARQVPRTGSQRR
jgi:hypothetical protein